MVAPYDPETGKWTVFADPRPAPKAPQPGREEWNIPATRPEAYTTQAILTGDVREAEKFIPVARQQMMAMHQINVNNLEVVNRPVDLNGGIYMDCKRSFKEDSVEIHVPVKRGVLGPMHFSFDGSSEQYYQSSHFTDKVNGLPLYFLPQNGGLVPGGPFSPPSFGIFNGSNGVGIQTGIVDENPYSLGALLFSPKTVSAFSTVFLVASILAGVDTITGSLAATYVDFQGKRFGVSVECHADGRFYITSDAGVYNDIESSGMKFIFCQTCTPTGSIVDGYPVVIYKSYFNGTQIRESELLAESMWYPEFPSGETLGDDEGDYIVKSLYCGTPNSHAAFHQAIYSNDTTSSDEIQKTTDVLAAKWGL